MMEDEIKVRICELIRILEDNGNVPATFMELKRVYEYMLLILERMQSGKTGFNQDEK